MKPLRIKVPAVGADASRVGQVIGVGAFVGAFVGLSVPDCGVGLSVAVGTTQYTCDGTNRRRRDVPSVFTPTAQPQLTFSEDLVEPQP